MGGEVIPSWICCLHQFHSFLTCPGFYMLFARNRCAHVMKRFEVHQTVNAIFGGKLRQLALSVLSDSSRQVVGDSCIQNSRPAR